MQDLFDLLANDSINFIKEEVEGQEDNSIQGMEIYRDTELLISERGEGL